MDDVDGDDGGDGFVAAGGTGVADPGGQCGGFDGAPAAGGASAWASDWVFESLFTADRPVVFAFHGYPWVVHWLIHGRMCAARFHVHGFNEEGTTTTPFDMTVLNGFDRFTLGMAAIERVDRVRGEAAHWVQHLRDRLVDHHAYVRLHGEDMPEVRDWRWDADWRS